MARRIDRKKSILGTEFKEPKHVALEEGERGWRKEVNEWPWMLGTKTLKRVKAARHGD